MDLQCLDLIDSVMPKINPVLAQGIARVQVREAEPYIDRDLRAASEQFPPGLEYLGMERCSFMEDYRELMKKRGEKVYVELARSDVYLVKLRFAWEGQEIESRPLYLPDSGIAGIMHVRGTPYMISPVIGDVAISVTREGLFVPLGSTKVQFMRLVHHFVMDGESKSVFVAHSNIYRRSKKSKAVKLGKRSRCSTLLHYMLCRHSFEDVFKDFFGCEAIVAGYEDTVSELTHPKDKWTIFRSTGHQPVCNRSKIYKPSRVCIAVPKTSVTPALLDAMGALFYVIDMFPERANAAHFHHIRLWQTLMGLVLFGEEVPEAERISLLLDHLDSLDGYINFQSRRTLQQGGVEVEDIYQFLSYIIHKMPELILTATTTVASLYDKRLMITRYLLSNVSYAIYKLMYRLRAQANKKGRLSAKEVVETMRKGLHRDTFINGISSNHAEVTPVSCPGDNMIFKITSNLVLQENTDSSRGRDGGGSLEDPSKFLHASLIEVASYCAMGKSEPTGRNKLNMYVKTSPRHDIVRNEENRALLDYVQSLVQR